MVLKIYTTNIYFLAHQVTKYVMNAASLILHFLIIQVTEAKSIM
jgi:hypothetical protein